MDFRILGPITACHRAGLVDLGQPQQRLVMGLLLLEPGRLVPTDRLVDGVWGDGPPATVKASLHNRIASLRRRLATMGVAIVSRPTGYLLEIDPHAVDVHRFTDLVTRGRSEGSPEQRARVLSEALELWRGPLLADLAHTAAVARYANALDELRLTANERYAEALIDLGEYDPAIDRLVALTADHPTRERLAGARMAALGRAGRVGEALQVYRDFWQRLDDELGIRPGPSLTALHDRLLSGDTASASYEPAPPSRISRPAASAVVPSQLPVGVPEFVGRDQELARLDALTASGTMVITGAGGAGKTSLALHWAGRKASGFPDGQLFADLRGWSDSGPVEPAGVLGGFLRSLGVEPHHIPTELEEASALFRSLTSGRRMLVLLDNAASVDQVRPLLPAGPSLTLVTSREALTGLAVREGAQVIDLPALDPAEAHAMLGALIGLDRITAEHDAADDLIELCGRLPLALRIAAAHLVADPSQTVAAYLSELRSGDPIAMLSIDGDRSSALETVFSHSYRSLPEPPQRLLRLLGAAVAQDATIESAAAVFGQSVEQTRPELQRLVTAHLVHRHDGRYAMHDLLGRYAARMAQTFDTAADRADANLRIYDFYLDTVDAAARVAFPTRLRLPTAAGPTDRPTRFDSAAQALDWLDGEQANLVVAIHQAGTLGLDPYSWQLTDALRGYFGIRRATTDGIAAARIAAESADRAGNAFGVCIAELCHGELRYARGDHPGAIERLTVALAAATAADWAEAEATAHSNIGGLLADKDELIRAEHHLAQAVRYYESTGGQSAALLSNLGFVLIRLGRAGDAAEMYVAALAMRRRDGQRDSEARLLVNLSDAASALGDHDDAVQHADDAVQVYREIRFHRGEIEALDRRAQALRDGGRIEEALKTAEQTRRAAVDNGNATTITLTSTTLGTVLTALGRPHDAVEVLTPTDDPPSGHHWSGRLLGLAEALIAVGEYDSGRAYAYQVLTQAQAIGAPVEEGLALVAIAAADQAAGDAGSAAQCARRGHDILLAIGHRPGLARATAQLKAINGAEPA